MSDDLEAVLGRVFRAHFGEELASEDEALLGAVLVAVAAQPGPQAGDREQLEEAIRRAYQSWTSGTLWVVLADAVEAVRPEPRALTEAWLREMAETLVHGHARHYVAPDEAARLLAHIRWLEDELHAAALQLSDRWLESNQVQAGAMQERREVVAELAELRESYCVGAGSSNVSATVAVVLGEVIESISSRGPVRPDGLHEVRAEARALREENERLKMQLPEGMQDCTIVFMSCPVGHGWLMATNWLPFDCPTCERNRLRDAIRRAIEVAADAREPVGGWWGILHKALRGGG